MNRRAGWRIARAALMLAAAVWLWTIAPAAVAADEQPTEMTAAEQAAATAQRSRASLRRVGPSVRLKDLATFQGVRANDLVGYGLVVGLAGTGDSLRNAPFTEEALSNLLERLGVNVAGETFRPKNIAAVLVTA
ncbi:MAG: flagellar basal body P-ring protein FlgI, partial [Paracoccaceae bacterium]